MPESTEAEVLRGLLDDTTRKLLDRWAYVISDTSGEIVRDKRAALAEVNAVRERAGLPPLTKEAVNLFWDEDEED